MSRILGILLALAMMAPAPARAGIEKAGTTAASFLSIGSGADVLGMGGATLGTGLGLNAAAWNVAALGGLRGSEYVFSHANLDGQSPQEWVAAGGRLGPLRTRWGATALYQGDGTFDGRDAFNNPTGSFSASSMALGAQFAQPLSPFVTVGLGAKYVSEKLGSVSGGGVTFDGGVRIEAGPVGIGLAAQNAFGKMNYSGAMYDFPTNYGVGVAYHLAASGLTFALDANFPDAYYPDVRGGLEWRWRDHLALRTGYRKEVGATDGEPLGGPTFGMGAGANGFWLDYGYLTGGISGSGQHRLGLTYHPGFLNGGMSASTPDVRRPASELPMTTVAPSDRRPLTLTSEPAAKPALLPAVPPAARNTAPESAATPSPNSSTSVAPGTDASRTGTSKPETAGNAPQAPAPITSSPAPPAVTPAAIPSPTMPPALDNSKSGARTRATRKHAVASTAPVKSEASTPAASPTTVPALTPPASAKTETPASVKIETPAAVKTETPAPVKTEAPAVVKPETPASVKPVMPAATNKATTPVKTEAPAVMKPQTPASVKSVMSGATNKATAPVKTEAPAAESKVSPPKTEAPAVESKATPPAVATSPAIAPATSAKPETPAKSEAPAKTEAPAAVTPAPVKAAPPAAEKPASAGAPASTVAPSKPETPAAEPAPSSPPPAAVAPAKPAPPAVLKPATPEKPAATPSGPRPAKVKVRSGETMADVARQWGCSVEAIMMENNLVSQKVKTGQTLKLPPAGH